jgi:hypothetical protein
MIRTRIALVLLSLLTSTVACGTGGPVARRSNEIRRAALNYELSSRGTVDEVLIAFGLTEVRANLGFEGGKTVWLNRFAEAEYFRRRPDNQTYIFLHGLSYEDGTASILIDRGDAAGVQSFSLTLRRDGGTWQVVSDEPR